MSITIGSLFHRWRDWGSERLRGLVSITHLSKVDSWAPDPKFVLSASFPSYLEPLDGILLLSCSGISHKPLIVPQLMKGGCGEVWEEPHVLHTCNTFPCPPPILPFLLLLSNWLRADEGERSEVTFKLVNLSSSPQRLVWERDAINLKNTVVFIFKNMIDLLQQTDKISIEWEKNHMYF